jgi:hypothetical protein
MAQGWETNLKVLLWLAKHPKDSMKCCANGINLLGTLRRRLRQVRDNGRAKGQGDGLENRWFKLRIMCRNCWLFYANFENEANKTEMRN